MSQTSIFDKKKELKSKTGSHAGLRSEIKFIYFKKVTFKKKSFDVSYWVNPKFIQFLWPSQNIWFVISSEKEPWENSHFAINIWDGCWQAGAFTYMWKGQATKYHNIIKRGLLCRWYWCLVFSCCIIRARDLWDWSYKLVELQAVPHRLLTMK